VPSSLYTSITWTATASGGTSPYTYLWSGDIYAASGTCSNSSTCVHNYNTLGTQTITVSVTSGTQTATASCSGNTSLPTASYNVSQSSLADISAALSNIAQKIQQLLGK
jgi:hypothetical protein